VQVMLVAAAAAIGGVVAGAAAPAAWRVQPRQPPGVVLDSPRLVSVARVPAGDWVAARGWAA
jgi:hypothetical protein